MIFRNTCLLPRFYHFDHSIFASTRLCSSSVLSSSVSNLSLSLSFLSSSRVVSLDGIPVLSVKEACDESLPYFSFGVAQRKKANRNLRFTMQAKEVGCARLIPTSWPAFIRDTWRFDKKKKRLAKSGSTLASHCLSSVPFNGVAQFVLILVEFNSLNYLQSDVNCIWDIVSMNNFLYHTFRF